MHEEPKLNPIGELASKVLVALVSRPFLHQETPMSPPKPYTADMIRQDFVGIMTMFCQQANIHHWGTGIPKYEGASTSKPEDKPSAILLPR